MKVLFLDIDGVVNCSKTSQRHRGMIGIDPYMALLVDRIIQATGCKVVLSSTWRLFEDSRAEVKRQVCDFMDVTPRLYEGIYAPNERGHEVKAWMDEWKKGTLSYHVEHNLSIPAILHEEIERYAILDDNTDFLPEQQDNFFKTEWFGPGLTEEIAYRVIQHLNLV